MTITNYDNSLIAKTLLLISKIFIPLNEQIFINLFLHRFLLCNLLSHVCFVKVTQSIFLPAYS